MREDRMMNEKKQSAVKRILGTRGMGAVITAFAGLIIIYVAFGLIDRKVFAGQNVMNLLRSMSKYLLIGVGQSYLLITGNIDLSIGSMVGMSAMIAATLMTTGMAPFLAIVIALIACLVVGVVNGYLVGKFKLPPFIATLGTMFVARGIAYMVNGNRNTRLMHSKIVFITVKHLAFITHSGSHLLFLLYFSLSYPRHVQAVIFTQSVLMWTQQSFLV